MKIAFGDAAYKVTVSVPSVEEIRERGLPDVHTVTLTIEHKGGKVESTRWEPDREGLDKMDSAFVDVTGECALHEGLFRHHLTGLVKAFVDAQIGADLEDRT